MFALNRCTPRLSLTTALLAALTGCGDNAPTPSSDTSATGAQVSVSSDADLASLTLGARTLVPEKTDLTFGFIKLTDCAPLVIAKEKGFFEAEGLNVQLEAQANWKILLERVIDGQLDGAHMLAGQPIAASVGVGSNAHVITPYSLDYNGNGITVSNAVWERMKPNVPVDGEGKPLHPIKADALKPIVEAAKTSGAPMQMGMVFPVSTHNYEIRYWLAAAGIHPGFYRDPETGEQNIQGVLGADVVLSVTPPPQMPATLEAGTIVGYCVGEPWNQQAVFKRIGVPVTTNYDIWKNNPEKVFGVTKDWGDTHPNTWLAVTKALIRAGHWLDASMDNRRKAVGILSQRNYVGADAEVIANSMTGTFEFERGDKRDMPDFNVFFRHNASYPWYSDCIWFLTQMVRWGQIPGQKPDSWYIEIAKTIYRPDIYEKAARLLIAEGKFTETDFPLGAEGFRPPTSDFIDGKPYDGRQPGAYVQSFAIGLR